MASKPYNEGKAKCYVSHKPLHFPDGGTLWGGNCSTPVLADLDVYVALESLSLRDDPRAYPWSPGQAFTFKIPNGGIPPSTVEFIRLVDWIVGQLKEGRSVHVGCIGGHGRTGMVLAAVCQLMGEAPNATQWVRDNYCEKAVETQIQVDFLDEVYGVTPVVPYYKLKSQAKKAG